MYSLRSYSANSPLPRAAAVEIPAPFGHGSWPADRGRYVGGASLRWCGFPLSIGCTLPGWPYVSVGTIPLLLSSLGGLSSVDAVGAGSDRMPDN